MNFNSKKETADKKERQGADDATKLQDEQVNAAEENATSDNVTDEGPEQKELEELKKKYTVVVVTHNMQQAARISDKTAFFLLGELVEFGPTEQVFSMPKDKRTEDYITGRFG